MPLCFPRSALFVPFHWHSLAEVIMLFSPLYMTDTFFSEKGNLKIQVTVQRPGVAFCHAWACGSAHSSCSTSTTARTSRECPAWLSIKENTHPREPCSLLAWIKLLVPNFGGAGGCLAFFYCLSLLLSQPWFGTRRRMLTRTSAMLIPMICSFCTF